MDNRFPSLGYFGFSDLHSFKDYVVYVLSCAPELFPAEDWLKAEEQMNLDRAFVGLELGFQLIAQEGVEPEIITQCRRLTAESCELYKLGQELDGQRCLEQVEEILKKIPSR